MVAQMVKKLPAMQKPQVRSLGQEYKKFFFFFFLKRRAEGDLTFTRQRQHDDRAEGFEDPDFEDKSYAAKPSNTRCHQKLAGFVRNVFSPRATRRRQPWPHLP